MDFILPLKVFEDKNFFFIISRIFFFHQSDLFEAEKCTSYQVTAIDINTSANQVYRLNHKATNCKLLERNIESLTSDDFDQMNLDLLTMSPPCQPFSRLGNQLDLQDSRSSSFKHLMQLFPRYILM